MGSQSRDIAEAIRALSGMDDLQYESILCNVSNIDTTKMLCTCIPINGDADFEEVRLNANYQKGFVLVPKNNSVVVVSQISNEVAYISMVSDVDQIYLAGDDNGGLVKVSDLVSKMNTIENDINTLKTIFSTWVPVPSDGGAALKLAAATWYASQLTPTQVNDLENKTVQHGNG
jgi:hypothetical protein